MSGDVESIGSGSAYVDDLAAAAAAAIETMKAAALAARAAHARAELMRHMLTTARKMADYPREAAIAGVVREWMAAWGVDAAWDETTARAMRELTIACLDAARAPGQGDARLRAAVAALDAAYAARGTSLADEMAWRSQCAHGWWEAVAPRPEVLPAIKQRPDLPRPADGRPFWDAGCSALCR